MPKNLKSHVKNMARRTSPKHFHISLKLLQFLSERETIVLCLLMHMGVQAKQDWFFCSIETLRNILHTSDRNQAFIIKKLVDDGLIATKRINRKRAISINYETIQRKFFS